MSQEIQHKILDGWGLLHLLSEALYEQAGRESVVQHYPLVPRWAESMSSDQILTVLQSLLPTMSEDKGGQLSLACSKLGTYFSSRSTRGNAIRLPASRKGLNKLRSSASDDARSSSAGKPAGGLSPQQIFDASATIHLLSESLIDSVCRDAVPKEYSMIVEHANQMTAGDVATAFHSLLPTLPPFRKAGTYGGGQPAGTGNGSGENDFR